MTSKQIKASLILVTLPTGAVFAARITNIVTLPYEKVFGVQNLLTGEAFTVNEASIAPLMVQAKLLAGGIAVVQVTRLDKQHPGDFFCKFAGQEVPLPRQQMLSIVLPTFAQAAA